MQSLFKILNSKEKSELRNSSPTYLTDFPYVNGRLFSQEETIPEFDARTRRMLLDCAALNWSEINPDIFGSMFQAVINENQRRRLGQHYTSVPNIMKVLRPLFLDPLEEEFIKSRHSTNKLKELLIRLGNIRVFDPACGSGNFLIIAFKELRQLEIRIFQALNALNAMPEMMMSNIRLNQFYGIEIDDFAQEIALLSLWLAEHQMNSEFNRLLHAHMATLPLHESGNILQGNSLRTNWEEFCPANKDQEIYVVGNPPFAGARKRNDEQTEDMEIVFQKIKSFKNLDYIASWFYKAAEYIHRTNANAAFVATNSISQGEQVPILWEPIFDLGISISFAYQSFLWRNNARDKASVYVVIIGLMNSQLAKNKKIYKEVDSTWHQIDVNNISPYLVEGNNLVINTRRQPLSKDVSKIVFGNMANDGGHLLLTTDEKEELIGSEPFTQKWIRKILGSYEFINGKERWCLWLKDVSSQELGQSNLVQERVKHVKEHRLNSDRPETKKLAEIPHLFGEIRQPEIGNYILVPSASTSRRKYIPLGFLNKDTITTNLNLLIPDGTLYEFGVLNSTLHNDWMRLVAGRLKQDYRYSGTLVYNTFPWPQNVGPQRRTAIEELAKEILKVRARHPDKTLADLYDPDKMPQDLLEAHENLDRAVEKLYRDAPFRDSTERVEYLFKLYEKLINEEEQAKSAKKKKKS